VEGHDRAAETGVVEQHIELAEMLFGGGDHPLDVGLDRDIDVDGHGGLADALGDILLLPAAVGTYDLGALLCEQDG
jgi:hypothetical protein